MPDIRFEDPPPTSPNPRGQRSHSHFLVAEAMRARPGEWAIVKVAATSQAARSSAHQVRSGRINAFASAGTFESMARQVDGENRVYARYVGTEAGDSDA